MDNLKRIEKKLKVIARALPETKFLLCDSLIRIGRTVAFIDRSILSSGWAVERSDVGFAIATGTDNVLRVCDIILKEDYFCGFLSAVKYGRNIFDNVRKFL